MVLNEKKITLKSPQRYEIETTCFFLFIADTYTYLRLVTDENHHSKRIISVFVQILFL